MARLAERTATAARAVASLRELIDRGLDDAVVRDAAIQRFEYSFEAVWKATQQLLREQHGVVVGSPKACIRAARQAGILGDDEAAAALVMADDRNETVHTYNEAVAQRLAAALPGHTARLEQWLGGVH